MRKRPWKKEYYCPKFKMNIIKKLSYCSEKCDCNSCQINNTKKETI